MPPMTRIWRDQRQNYKKKHRLPRSGSTILHLHDEWKKEHEFASNMDTIERQRSCSSSRVVGTKGPGTIVPSTVPLHDEYGISNC